MPQMMPLPWLMVFSLIFFCFFTLNFYLSFFYFFCSCDSLNISAGGVVFPW